MVMTGGCGGLDVDYDDGDDDFVQPVIYEPGEDTYVVTETIGATGGTIEAGSTGTPADGIKVLFPSGALESDTKISLGYNYGTMTPNWDNAERGDWNGSAIALEIDGVSEFGVPIEITMPWQGARYGIIALYHVEENGRLIPCQIKEINDNEQTVTFTSISASDFVTVIPIFSDERIPHNRKLDFQPSRDGFSIKNFASDNDGGKCIEMAAFSIWYWNWNNGSGKTLRPLAQFSEDAQRRIATGSRDILAKFFNDIDGNFDELFTDTDDYRVRRLLKNFVINSGPVMICLRGTDTDNGNTVYHQIVFFGYDMNDSTKKIDFQVYDPNSPGETRHIIYDDLKGVFEPYIIDGASFPSIGYGGTSVFNREVSDAFKSLAEKEQ
jgi:hypothetical protein